MTTCTSSCLPLFMVDQGGSPYSVIQFHRGSIMFPIVYGSSQKGMVSYKNNVGKTIINHPPVITIFMGGMVTIPSHGWFMALCYSHYIRCFRPGFVQQLAAMQEHPQGLGCCNPADFSRRWCGVVPTFFNHWVQRAQVPSQLLDLQTYQVVYASC